MEKEVRCRTLFSFTLILYLFILILRTILLLLLLLLLFGTVTLQILKLFHDRLFLVAVSEFSKNHDQGKRINKRRQNTQCKN